MTSMQLEDDDDTAEKIMDAYLPLEYRKFYEGLPAQILTHSPPNKQILEWNEKDILQSPGANTVSTVASSVVSSLTPPFVVHNDDNDHHHHHHRMMCPPSPSRTSGRGGRGGDVGLRTALRASLLRECEQRRHRSFSGGGCTSSIDVGDPEPDSKETSLLVLLRRELNETKKALRKLEAKVERKDVGRKNLDECYNDSSNHADQEDQISTTSTEAVSGGEILHIDPWNDSVRSFVSISSDPMEFLTVPDEVSVISRTFETSSTEEAVQAAQAELKKSERHAKLVEAKLRASEAVASTLFKSLTDIRKKQREMERLNKDRGSCEDVELMVHHSRLLLIMGPAALVMLAGGYAELFAAIVFVLFFSLEVVSDDTASS